MRVITELLIYMLLGLLFYLYDIKTQKYNPDCTNTAPKKITFNLNLLLHHIISTSFWHFAWLSTNKNILLFYIIFGTIIVGHWKIFGDCIFSLKAREHCNGKYDFPMHHIHQSIIPRIIYPYFNMYYMYIIAIIKLLLLYKYNDPSILYKINIIIISFIIIYSYNTYKKKQLDTGL